MMQQQHKSPELEVFQEKYPDIYNLISSNIRFGLVNMALAKGLISQTSERTISDPFDHLTANARTTVFMNELKSSIEADPSALEKFIDLLSESDAAYYAMLIKNISEFHVTYCLLPHVLSITAILREM